MLAGPALALLLHTKEVPEQTGKIDKVDPGSTRVTPDCLNPSVLLWTAQDFTALPS